VSEEQLKAPFVWFGGKRKVAQQVWSALGDVDNYIEPFAGSLAVLLGRPGVDPLNRLTETVNDADGFLANFWRAVALDPNAVAHHASWPVNEVDLLARHLWLVNTGRSRLLEGLESDPDWFDAKIAGWWVWGVNSWIGSGWCSGAGPWMHGADGTTVEKLPHLGNAGRKGYLRQDVRKQGVTDYFQQLADRLRDVRVCNGDWSRVVTNGATSFGSKVGVFLDPPYLGDVRTADLYAVDDHHIANDVRQWALDHGNDPRFRIVLAGYSAEHDHLIPDTWRRVRWSASVAYQTTNSAKTDGGNQVSRHGEVLWCSPHCLGGEIEGQLDIFGGEVA
jgi:site-specific DNA-adenine methylase